MEKLVDAGRRLGQSIFEMKLKVLKQKAWKTVLVFWWDDLCHLRAEWRTIEV